ncbi:hypothetical protein QE152_g40327 [Popillia japonica]|uniref:Uncharacterized protein n=1 Tax=Popillia japonica TaxID=7064 RepID=A0AAW1HRJ7_POPJA
MLNTSCCKNTRGTYNKCCFGGNVFLAPFTQHPQELRRLFTGQHRSSREFKRNINVYNNCFQFASVQANLREIPGQGPFVYAVQGQIYHHYSDININREQQSFGPIYYLDPEEAIQQRIIADSLTSAHIQSVDVDIQSAADSNTPSTSSGKAQLVDVAVQVYTDAKLFHLQRKVKTLKQKVRRRDLKISSMKEMPRKPRFTRRKGKQQGTNSCSIKSNCSDISARTTQLTQASDRTTQLTDIVPDSWQATPPKRSRSMCTCNQPGSSVNRCPIHNINADDKIENDFGENIHSIRTTTANVTQTSQMSIGTIQMPNTIPDCFIAIN